MNVNSPSAVGRHFLNQNIKSSAESGLVPVLLRIKAVPENIYVRFDALCLYALEILETFPRVFSFKKSRINENGGNTTSFTFSANT